MVVERWILARLRNRRFFGLVELNKAIALLLVDLNQRAYKKLSGNRRSAFEQIHAPTLMECFSFHQRVACHALSHLRGRHTTIAEHMPASHRAHPEWTPQKRIDWGLRIGVSTAAVETWQLEHRPHTEQGYRACLGMQRLARQYTPIRLEAACA